MSIVNTVGSVVNQAQAAVKPKAQTAATPTTAIPAIPPTPTSTTGVAPTAPAATPAAPSSLTPSAPKPLSSIPGVQGTLTDPSNDLRSQTLSVGPTADRLQLANSYLNNWNTSTQPQFDADVRGATSNSAALGQLGSGQLRTSVGNLVANRDTQRNAQAQNFYNDALTGSISDAYNNLGIAQQQQAFQSSLQNQTYNQWLSGQQLNNQTQAQQFGQAATQAQLQDQFTNSAFNRASQTYQLGTQGNPSNAYQNLANQYGASAQNGYQGLTNTIAGAGSGQNTNDILSILRQYGLIPGASSSSAPTGAPIMATDPGITA